MKENFDVQGKLKEIVKWYKVVFPEEYQAVCQIVGNKRNNLKKKSGALETNPLKSDMFVERALFEVSETLQAIIYRRLDSLEFAWFTSKEGGRWFAKNFREFALGQ
ncbi:MAG: hypothetical protein [Siphoviridae sp. cttb18]|nr:MAG: hypothetical protein [Siphoviridae sp. cttb18]